MAEHEYDDLERRSNDERLRRIEHKLDKMNDAIVALARVEEKMIASEKDRSKITSRLDKLEEHWLEQIDKLYSRIKDLEESQTKNRVLYKISMPFFTAIIAGAAGYFFKGN